MDFLKDIYLSNLNMVYNIGGFFSIENNQVWSLSESKFEQCKFYYILEGQCTITIKNNEYLLKKGDWLFLPPNTYHSYHNDTSMPFKKYWAHFDIYPDTNIVEYLSLPYIIQVKNNNQITKLFNKLVNSAKSNNLIDKLMVKSCLFSLLSEFINIAKPNGVSIKNQKDERLDNVLRYINENLDKSLNNDILAEKYFAHPNHFIRAFKDKTGMTPAKYIKLRKMETAKQLLESTDLSNEEITEKLNLSDSSHFSKLFKEVYNMSPRKYRTYFKLKLIT